MSSPVPLAPQTTVQSSSGVPRLFIRRSSVLISLTLSAVLLIPCFWHPRIEAGDLASHTYNAWLSSLVLEGKAPGLWIARQHNNVLFDILLLRLGSAFGFMRAEKFAMSIAVLLFFWSGFVLISIVNGRAGWFLAPLLAMLSYGWTLEMGFMNFYLSLALSFLALAIVWKADGLGALYALLICPLIWLAHPLGLAWFLAAALYVSLARRLSSTRWVLAATSLMVVVVLRFFLGGHFQVLWPTDVVWPDLHFYEFTGPQQLLLATRYWPLPWAILLVAAGCVALDMVNRRARQQSEELRLNSQAIALPLFAVSAISLMLLPDGIRLPQYADPVLFICARFTLASGVLACCALGALRDRSRWVFGILSGAIALVFFALLYRDTGRVFAMERQAETLVAHVPQGARIISTLAPLPGSQVFSHHVVARACIDHCLVIDNYETATGQFRLRATAESRMVSPDTKTINEMMMGFYDVKPADLPLWHIFQCGPSDIDLCLRPLRAGPLGAPRPAGMP